MEELMYGARNARAGSRVRLAQVVPEDEDQIEQAEDGKASSGGDQAPRPRRRSRAVLRGARIRRRPSVIRLAMMAVLIGVIAAAALWAVRRHFTVNPRYRLATIELRGEKHLGKSEVEAVFKPDQGRTIYAIPLDERRRQIEEIAWVHHASVTRVPPGEIWVRVEEREPLAFLWSPRGVNLIDSDGIVLDVPPETFFSLPVVRGVGLREAEESRRAKLRQLAGFLEAIKAIAPEAVERISEVNLADVRNVRAIVADGDQSVLLHFGDELFGQRFQTYQTHIAEWRRQFTEMQSIDLRYEGQAVIHSDGSQPVRVENPGTKPAQTVPPLKPSTGAARAETQSQPEKPAPSPMVQEAGMVPSFLR